MKKRLKHLMPGRGKRALEQEVAGLRGELALREERIRQLEQLTEIHDRIESLAHQELLAAAETIKAQETVQELMTEERRSAEETIKAQERLQSLSEIEKREAAEQLGAQQAVSQLSRLEILRRDAVLRYLLDLSRDLSAILDPDVLLSRILDTLVVLLDAEAAVLFLYERHKMEARGFRGYPGDGNPLAPPAEMLELLPGIIEDHQCRLVERTAAGRSLLAVPFVYRELLLGVLCMETAATFREVDREWAELFAAQAAIALYNAQLYRRLGEKNRSLLHLVNLKDSFISHVSEDLRPPLAALQAEAAKLQQLPGAEDAAARILRHAGKLVHTTEKVLVVASLEAETRELFRDTVDIPALVGEVLGKYKTEVEKRKLVIGASFDPEFSRYPANQTIFRTIFDELVSNAIYYNREHGSVTITGKIEGEMLAVEIADTGHGIRGKDLERIFEQFYRSEDSADLNEWGAGLGLFMVRTFVMRYGGDVQVESRHEEGSRFRIRFLRQAPIDEAHGGA